MLKAVSFGRHLVRSGVRFAGTNAIGPDPAEPRDYDKPLDGKIAIVTGSSKGIGFEIAKRMAIDGAHVVISSRSADNVAKAVDKLKEQNLNISGGVCNIKMSEDRKRLISETVKNHGKLDIVVPNVGIDSISIPNMMDTTEDLFDEMFDLNVKSTFFMIKEAFPHLQETQGAVTILSTGAAFIGQLESNAYFLSKSAAANLTKALLNELLIKKVRINAVALGMIDTEQGKEMFHLKEKWEKYRGFVALDRLGHAEECAGMVSFLCGPDSTYISGETFSVGGGLFYRL